MWKVSWIPLTHLLVSPLLQKKRPLWLKDTLENAKKHIAPRGTFRESKKLDGYQGYLATMSTIVQSEPCTFEEVVKHQDWKDALNEELLIWGSIRCALSLKFCREAWAHALQRTQKLFWEIPPRDDYIKIINIFNGVPKSKLRKIKIIMGINIMVGESSR